MPAKKQWDEEKSESSTPPSSPPITAARRRQFEDEEDDSDVLESWDAAEDSDVEREKERKAAEAKAKAVAEAAASKKSKAARIAEHQATRARQREDEEDIENETDAQRRERIRRQEEEAGLRDAEDFFGDLGISTSRTNTIGAAVVMDANDPSKTVNLASLPLLNPQTKKQFELLRTTVAPIISANAKKAHYGLFLEDFAKDLAKELSSDQVKKVASALTRLSNEKMKEEKAADKGGKKTKAAKTKTSLVTSRPNTTDVSIYDDDGFGDDDFL